MGILTSKRGSNVVGCASQIVVIAAVFAVIAFALTRLGDVFEQGESAQSDSATAPPTVAPPTRTPTVTPAPSPMWAVTADILQITVVSAAATDEYAARSAKMTQERADVVSQMTQQAPATAAMAEIERQAAQAAQAADQAMADQNRVIDAQKRYFYEFAVPGFCISVIAGLAFGFAVWFGNLVMKFAEEDGSGGVVAQDSGIIEVHAGNAIRRSKYDDQPFDHEDLVRVAHGVARGCGLSDVRWIGNGFTRAEWYSLRQWLIDNGFARWKNSAAHNQGAQLTRDGWALFRKISDENPHPIDGDAENGVV